MGQHMKPRIIRNILRRNPPLQLMESWFPPKEVRWRMFYSSLYGLSSEFNSQWWRSKRNNRLLRKHMSACALLWKHRVFVREHLWAYCALLSLKPPAPAFDFRPIFHAKAGLQSFIGVIFFWHTSCRSLLFCALWQVPNHSVFSETMRLMACTLN